MRRERQGVSLMFASSGVIQSSWASRLPALWDRLDSGPAEFALALTALGVGTLVPMVAASRGLLPIDDRWVARTSALIGGVALLAVSQVGEVAQLAAVLLVFGMAVGAWDTAMNVEGTAAQARAGTDWMYRFHGWWSVGTVCGAVGGVVAAALHVPLLAHFLLAAAVAVVMCLIGVALVEGHVITPDEPPHVDRRRLWMLGALILLGATAEGAAGDWLAVYLRDDRGLSYSGAALGYATFVGAMAAGRFVAHGLRRRIGPMETVRLGVVLAVVGALVAVLSGQVVAMYLGALCWGLGVSVVVPAALSASGRLGNTQSVVARMTLVAYASGLAGPASVGAVAHWAGFAYALTVLVPALSLAVIGLTSALADPVDEEATGA